MIPLDPQLRASAPGPVVALPTGGADRVEGDLVKALLASGRIEARVLQVVNQTALIDFLDLGRAKVRTEVPLRAGDAFTAVVEPQTASDRGAGAEMLKLRIADLRHEPAAPLKAEHMAARLEEMNLPSDSRHQAMARALLRHAGTVSREALVQLDEALKQLASRASQSSSAANTPAAGMPSNEAVPARPAAAAPGAPASQAQAAAASSTAAAAAASPSRPLAAAQVIEAAAFLVAKGLPVTEESVAWVASRLQAQATPAERLAQMARMPDSLPPAAAQALMELGLPDDGTPAETAQHLAKLAQAFTAPEAKIARALAQEAPAARPESAAPATPATDSNATDAKAADPARPGNLPEPARSGAEMRMMAEPMLKIREALSAVLERAVRGGEGGESLREALAEVRFGQLMNASTSEAAQAGAERSLAMPLWWSGGSGEIRVQYRSKDGKRRAGSESAETRVVVTLDTSALSRVRVDLLLAKKQLNCQVVVEAEAVADVLRQRLPELQEALESTGLRVNALGVKHATPKTVAAPVDALRQVDVWL